MKTADFSKLGGMARTQNLSAFLQTAWQEVFLQLQNLGVNSGAPVRVSGMQVTVAGSNVTVTSGWFIYQGVMIPFTGSTVTLGAGEVALVVISPTDVANYLPYATGGTPAVLADQSAALTHAATVTDATHFPVTSLVDWMVTSWIENRASANADTINFVRNRTIVYSAVSAGPVTHNLDFTSAVPGCEVLISIPTVGATVTYTIGGGATLIGEPPANVGTYTYTTIRLKYVGNISGTNYVMVESWQHN